MLRGQAPVKGILRQLAFDCRILRKVTDVGYRYRMTGSYSMLMRSVHGSRSAAGLASAVLGASLAVAGVMEAAVVEICSFALRTVSSIDPAVTGDVSPAGATLSSGGAISRASTGKSCACCSAHFAASPFKGLLVLYS